MKLTRFFLILSTLAAAIMGCTSHCSLGQEIVIPSADLTDPSVIMDFHLLNGSVVTVRPGSTTSMVPVPGGGKVTVIVNAKDSEGIQDAQIWAEEIIYTTDPDTGIITSQSAPGLISSPTASNRDSGSRGQKGCTERIASTNLDVRKSSTGGVNYDVRAVGVNFGGKSVRTAPIRLVGQ